MVTRSRKLRVLLIQLFYRSIACCYLKVPDRIQTQTVPLQEFTLQFISLLSNFSIHQRLEIQMSTLAAVHLVVTLITHQQLFPFILFQSKKFFSF